MKKKSIKKQAGQAAVPKTKRQPHFWKLEKPVLLALLFIIALTLIAYFPSLKNDFTNWDDQVYVTENPWLGDFSKEGFKILITQPFAANYHPLTMLSLALNYQTSGLNAFGYHFTNLIFHLFNTVLVFFFIYLLANRNWKVAAFTSIFFAIHPMHVESVAWVAERKDVLFTFFFLLSLITYLRFIEARKAVFLIASFLFFALSILSKPAAVILPVALFLIDYFRLCKFSVKSFLEKIPFFLLAFVWGYLTMTAQDTAGALGEGEVFSFGHRVLFASHGFIMYIAKLFVPFRLSAFYPYPFMSSIPVFTKISPLFVIGLIAGTWAFRKNRAFVFGFAFYTISVVLVLQLISFGNAIMADRYTYIAYIGLLFPLGFGLDNLVKKRNPIFGKAMFAGVMLVAVFFSHQTFERCKIWQNGETLWTDVIKKFPDRKIGHYNRAHYFHKIDMQEKAIKDYSSALIIKPDYYEALHNRGRLYSLKGKYEAALTDFTKAIAANPDDHRALMNRGNTYLDMKKLDLALADYQLATELFPEHPAAFYGKGNANFKLNKYRQAIVDYTKALALKPQNAEYLHNRSVSYGHLGDKKNALADELRAIEFGQKTDETYMKWLRE